MPDLAVIARERAALTTVADAVVAASVGKGLRVAVTCPISRLALVDYLAQALHARGRNCRCLPAEPLGDAGLPAAQQDGGAALVVIVSGFVTETDRNVQRVSIRVTSAVPIARRGEAGHQGTDEPPPPATDDPDVILDYGDPSGPVIRYLAPYLSGGRQP